MHESLRPVRRGPRYQSVASVPRKRLPKFGVVIVAVIIAVVGISTLGFGKSTAAISESAIRSGITGKCLDVRHNTTVDGTVVQLWNCNASPAQDWTVSATTIRHGDDVCLTVMKDAKLVGSIVGIAKCAATPGQIWLRDGSGYYNPNSQRCLMAPVAAAGSTLILANCTDLQSAAKRWYPQATSTACTSSQGQRIACVAANEWSGWQTSSNHTALLDRYTGGAPYEAWCADFVSYVYKQAGYAFTNGSNNGWDENIAENIQNLGFTKHYASIGYQPKAGDVAYFDYAGGHVEIVVSGGPHPTFVYGNSGKTDPTTGNGDMAANNVTHDANGSVVYYLSPQ